MDFTFSAISIEDHQEDAAQLRELLSLMPGIRYDGNATTYDRGRDLIMRRHPDLIFLDIDLPDANGIEVASEIRTMATWPMQIVFYTVYDTYVIEALRNAAFDYLVKPVKKEEMRRLIDRFVKDYNDRFLTRNIERDKAEYLDNSIIMVNTIQGYQQIRLADIVYIEHIPHTKYWRLFLSNGSAQTMRKETSAQMILSMYKHFVQVNQSQILNLKYLGIMRRDSCTLLPPFQDVEINISRNYQAALQARMYFI